MGGVGLAACTRQPRFPDFLCACNLFQLGDVPVDVSSVSSLRLLTGQKVCLFFFFFFVMCTPGRGPFLVRSIQPCSSTWTLHSFHKGIYIA